MKVLSHKKLRDVDESSKNAKDFDIDVLLAAGESVPVA